VSHLLLGQNSLLIDERIARLRGEIDPGSFNTSSIDVQTATLQEIAAAIQATPFFGGRRLVVLLNPIGSGRRATSDDIDDDGDAAGRIRWPELSAVLTSAPASTVLILRHDGSLTQTHFLVKAARSAGWTIETFAIPRGDELLDWVTRRSSELGTTISSDAAIELLELLHPTSWRKPSPFDTDVPNPRLIASELAKLASGASDEVISSALVNELVADRAGYTAFQLNDRVFSGRTTEALVELASVLEAGEPEERIIALLASEAAALASAGSAREFGSAAVASAAGMSESRLNSLQRRAVSANRPTLRRVAEAIRASDALVKRGHASDASETIAPAVAAVAEAMRAAGRSGQR
jgi:DNA polymerase III delta subunit